VYFCSSYAGSNSVLF
nr:immunoglobulin light chain junction region [Macaca mulatta]